MQQPNVAVRPHDIETADGADSIVLGAGVHVAQSPIAPLVRGRGGRTVAEARNGSPRADKDLTVSGFLTLLLMVEPNSGLGYTSLEDMMEARHRLHPVGAAVLAKRARQVRADARERYNTASQAPCG